MFESLYGFVHSLHLAPGVVIVQLEFYGEFISGFDLHWREQRKIATLTVNTSTLTLNLRIVKRHGIAYNGRWTENSAEIIDRLIAEGFVVAPST